LGVDRLNARLRNFLAEPGLLADLTRLGCKQPAEFSWEKSDHETMTVLVGCF
jgi:hypothetical protein